MDAEDVLKAAIKVATKTAGAAAGAAAGTAGGPIAAAAASSATEQAVTTLLEAVRGAEQQQAQKLLALNQEIHGRLIGVQADLATLLTAPQRTALEYIQEAAQDPDGRTGNLELARQRLFDALGTASAPAQKAFVARQIALVSAMLGRQDDVTRWLDRARREVDEASRSIARDIHDLYAQGAADSATRQGRQQQAEVMYTITTWLNESPSGGPAMTAMPVVAVEPSLLTPHLHVLLELTLQALALRHAAAQVESYPGLGRVPVFARPSGDRGWMIDGGEDGLRWYAADPVKPQPDACITRDWPIGWIQFRLEPDPPRSLISSGDIRVVGNCPELGDWNPAHGLPLSGRPHHILRDGGGAGYPWFDGDTLVSLTTGTHIEYKYVHALNDDYVWEGGDNHLCDLGRVKEAYPRDTYR